MKDHPEFDELDDESDSSATEELDSESQLAEQVAELTDRNLRLQADMENLRHRTSREMEEARRFSTLPLIRDLLQVSDNISRAIEAAEKANESGTLLEGFRMVAQMLQTILERHHCREIAAAGELFDPNLHEAIQQMPSEEHPPGHVAMVTQSGFQLHDRVIRPSQVIVSTGPSK